MVHATDAGPTLPNLAGTSDNLVPFCIFRATREAQEQRFSEKYLISECDFPVEGGVFHQ